MPFYFFHARGGEVECDDDEGSELPSDQVAREKATYYARDLLAAAVMDGRLALHESIVVEDDGGRTILTLTFGEAVGLSSR